MSDVELMRFLTGNPGLTARDIRPANSKTASVAAPSKSAEVTSPTPDTRTDRQAGENKECGTQLPSEPHHPWLALECDE